MVTVGSLPYNPTYNCLGGATEDPTRIYAETETPISRVMRALDYVMSPLTIACIVKGLIWP